MSQSGAKNSVALGLAVIAAAASIVGIFWGPFLLGPLAAIAVLIAAALNTTNTALVRVAMFTVGAAFLLGAALAVAGSHPLY